MFFMNPGLVQRCEILRIQNEELKNTESNASPSFFYILNSAFLPFKYLLIFAILLDNSC
jgi:hypothetical protein